MVNDKPIVDLYGYIAYMKKGMANILIAVYAIGLEVHLDHNVACNRYNKIM